MEMFPLSYILFFLMFFLPFKFFLQSRKYKNLPPGPSPLPIIGNLHLLERPLHHFFQRMLKKHGNIFSRWFGSRLAIVVSSPSAFHECFTKNDVVLANRPRSLSGKRIFYDYTTVGSSSYGEHRRNLRRIVSLDILSTQRIHSFVGIRKDETNRLVYHLAKVSRVDFAQVELGSMFHDMAYNNMMRMISRKIYYGEESLMKDVEEAREFRETVAELLQLAGVSNKAMLFAGSDPSAETLEWSLSNVLNHPEVLKKVRDEIDTHLGQDRLLNESDLPKLPYLKKIILETLRLYSHAPLPIPHVSSDDITIGEFNVPQNTMVMVNIWAIQRDPQLWNEPECFKPERFDEEGLEKKLVAYGMGGRACRGGALAMQNVGLTLGLLIQCFDWKRKNDEEIDMREKN